MAFPWTFESNFESGDVLEWDSETDTVNQLDIAHYSDLARFPWARAVPYSGAYCMRLSLTGGTADAFLTEGDLNIAVAGREFYRFNVFFSPDFAATADDTFALFELQGAADAIQAVFGARVVAATGVINLGIGELAATGFGHAIERGHWYTIELDVLIDSGAPQDGTIDIYVTRADEPATTVVYATQISGLDQIAVTHGVLGVQNHLATTTGVILIDGFISDVARIYPAKRYAEEILLTKSGHAFVGSGKIDNVSLLSGAGTDCVVSVFDTDEADVNDANNIVVELKNTANNELVDPAGSPNWVNKGAYVQLAGTNPRALLKMARGALSDGRVRQIGLRR